VLGLQPRLRPGAGLRRVPRGARRQDRGIAIGDPTDKKVWLGPLVNAKAAAKYEAAVAEAKRDGRIVAGGELVAGKGSDLYAAPTIVADLPADHHIWRDELFIPLVAVAKVDTLDDAFERANDTIYGLTAGFFSDDNEEIENFKEKIEAGVIYINRRAGATTGAWPGIQPFGGWKGSGHQRQGLGRPVLRPAVHAGAVADARRLIRVRAS
jgi:1-pyrroline-5-carboxylate dehydrogenase